MLFTKSNKKSAKISGFFVMQSALYHSNNQMMFLVHPNKCYADVLKTAIPKNLTFSPNFSQQFQASFVP